MSEKITLKTKHDLVDDVARGWDEQYGRHGMPEKDAIHARLVAEKPKTVKAVAEIIGNDSWTRLECDCCEKDKEWLIIFEHHRSDYHPSVCLCYDCLSTAMDKFRSTAA